MSKRTEYLLHAEFCKQMADKATTTERKAPWLALAGKWITLADERPENETGEPPVIAPSAPALKAVS